MDTYTQIGIGIASGAIYGGLFFLKSEKAFDVKKFGVTLCVGAIVGAGMSMSGTLSQDAVLNVMGSAGAVMIVQNIMVLLNNWTKPVQTAVGTAVGKAMNCESILPKKKK